MALKRKIVPTEVATPVPSPPVSKPEVEKKETVEYLSNIPPITKQTIDDVAREFYRTSRGGFDLGKVRDELRKRAPDLDAYRIDGWLVGSKLDLTTLAIMECISRSLASNKKLRDALRYCALELSGQNGGLSKSGLVKALEMARDALKETL